jgi:Tfp pilus assembly protein PilF
LNTDEPFPPRAEAETGQRGKRKFLIKTPENGQARKGHPPCPCRPPKALEKIAPVKKESSHWWHWVLRAQSEKSINKSNAIYREGMKKFHGNSEFLGEYALYLKNFRKDFKRAQEMFERALKIDLNSYSNLGNYANFLKDCLKEYNKAEEMYGRALKIKPDSTVTAVNYALFLHAIRREYDRAQELYERALVIEPNNPITLSSYASFLFSIRKENNRAQQMFERALIIEPNSVINLSSYALFLYLVRNEYEKAQEMFEKAFAIDPQNHFNNCNYATFLKDFRKDFERARELYERATKDAPFDAHYLGNYAGFLLAQGIKEKGLPMLQQAISLLRQDVSLDLASELWFYAFAHCEAEKRSEALTNLRQLILGKIARSPEWDFSLNIQRAIRDKHPDATWLPMLANVINGKAEATILADWPAWRNA